MSGIKFCYFDARGFGEVSRLTLALAGQKFEDLRWSREDWPKYKPDAPFGQGPWLEYKGKKIGQSAAIATFLAREFGLYGKTNFDGAVIDQVIHIFKDLISVWSKSFSETDEAKKEELNKKMVDEEVPKFMGHFIKLLDQNPGSPLFIGNSVTLADIYVFDMMFQLNNTLKTDIGAKYPKLQALYDRVASEPNIKAYLANRKETPM